MDQILDINLTFDGNTLFSVDTTIDNLPDNALSSYYEHYYTIDFVAHSIEENVLGDSIYISKVTPGVNQTYDYTIADNGRYFYYKLSVPEISYFINKDVETLVGEIFIYQSHLMQIIRIPANSSLESILNNSASIGYYEAYKAVSQNISFQTEANESYFFPKKEVFSTCKLRKCLVYLQRKMLLGNCTLDDCAASKADRNLRDFLLSAIYVLDYLKETDNLEEAQRIIDNISFCNFPCEEDSLTFNGCGCGNNI